MVACAASQLKRWPTFKSKAFLALVQLGSLIPGGILASVMLHPTTLRQLEQHILRIDGLTTFRAAVEATAAKTMISVTVSSLFRSSYMLTSSRARTVWPWCK